MVALVASCKQRANILRGFFAAKLANLGEGRPAKNTSNDVFSRKKAAKALNVGKSSVVRVKRVIDHGSKELQADVERGFG
jgi:hypothetical protein